MYEERFTRIEKSFVNCIKEINLAVVILENDIIIKEKKK